MCRKIPTNTHFLISSVTSYILQVTSYILQVTSYVFHLTLLTKHGGRQFRRCNALELLVPVCVSTGR